MTTDHLVGWSVGKQEVVGESVGRWSVDLTKFCKEALVTSDSPIDPINPFIS